MKIGSKGLGLIKKFEGFFSKPYLCPAGVPTIGYGLTYYPSDKRKVTLKDKPITEQVASQMLIEVLVIYEKEVLRFVKKTLTQNQFDALVSFCYNVGGTNLGKSTLLKKININPNDPSIASEFAKWNKAGGRVLAGLVKRRLEESNLYFSKS
jgi:lysozyme